MIVNEKKLRKERRIDDRFFERFPLRNFRVRGVVPEEGKMFDPMPGLIPMTVVSRQRFGYIRIMISAPIDWRDADEIAEAEAKAIFDGHAADCRAMG